MNRIKGRLLRMLLVPVVAAGALVAVAPAASADITWNYGSPNCSIRGYHMRNSFVPGVYATHAYNYDRHRWSAWWKWSYVTTLYSFAGNGDEIKMSYTTQCSALA